MTKRPCPPTWLKPPRPLLPSRQWQTAQKAAGGRQQQSRRWQTAAPQAAGGRKQRLPQPATSAATCAKPVSHASSPTACTLSSQRSASMMPVKGSGHRPCTQHCSACRHGVSSAAAPRHRAATHSAIRCCTTLAGHRPLHMSLGSRRGACCFRPAPAPGPGLLVRHLLACRGPSPCGGARQPRTRRRRGG